MLERIDHDAFAISVAIYRFYSDLNFNMVSCYKELIITACNFARFPRSSFMILVKRLNSTLGYVYVTIH